MIFPWDSEIHQCITCKGMTIFDELPISVYKDFVYEGARIVATWVFAGWKECQGEFHIIDQDDMGHFHAPRYQDFIDSASSFKEYYQ